MNTPLTRRDVLRCGATAASLLLPRRAPAAPKTAASTDRYRKAVRDYVDCLLAQGRDTYGPQHSPLFAEALDRRTLKLLDGAALQQAAALKFEAWGIRPHDRMLGGANPMHCENLYQVLYVLSVITGDPRYAAEADKSLTFFFTHSQSPATGLFYWGEHAGWDFRADAPLADKPSCNTHEFYRPWVLWDHSWNLAPEACLKFARGLWEHQIADHRTGDYSRHAAIDKHGPGTGASYPRHGGCYIETWAWAYRKTQDPVFLQAIETVVDGLERMRRDKGMIVGNSIKKNPSLAPRSESLAVSLWEAAQGLPDLLATKLREIARANDLPEVADPSVPVKSSNLWSDGYGGSGGQIASRGCLLALRDKQCQPKQYRARILAIADVYRTAPVNLSFPVYPGTFGKVILLLCTAYWMTGEQRYLDQADTLAAQALELFLPDGSPLPKATHQHDHYEAVTNGDTLMMALEQLASARDNMPPLTGLIYTDR